jgi:fumarate reductase flavoprotein subunit
MGTWTEPDVAVVGGGLAGLVAANRAAELGAQVAVFEAGAAQKYRANSRFTGGVFHIAFRDIESPPDVLLDAIRSATGGFADPTLAQALAQNGARAVRWLAGHGAVFGEGGTLAFMRRMLVPFSLREPGFANHWPDKGADRLLSSLEQTLVAHGGQLVRGMRARRLKMSEGRCAGLELTDVDGRMHTVTARCVVICDGGFQGNPELVRRYLSPRPESLCMRGAGTGVGDGLSMAAAVGAKLVHMDKFYGHVQCSEALTDDALWPYPILDIVASAAVVVNGQGQRFTDEGLGGVSLANAVGALPDPLSSFVVMDEAIWNGAGREFLLPPNPTMEQRGVKIHRADTLEALAEQLQMPAAALLQTVAQYNDAIARGAGPRLDPPRSGEAGTLSRGPQAICQAPFLAIRLCAGITYTMGGIAIDADGRVLDTSDHPIAGLYAAGSATGGLEGGPQSGYVGGLAKAAVFGLRAGEAVVRDAGLTA